MGMSARCVYVLSSCHHFSLVPSPSRFLFFSYNTQKQKNSEKWIFSTLPLPCIILNANQRTKNWKGLGTRLSSLMCAINHSTFHSFIYQSDLFSTLHGVPVVSWGSHEVQENRNLSGVCPVEECLPDMPLR